MGAPSLPVIAAGGCSAPAGVGMVPAREGGGPFSRGFAARAAPREVGGAGAGTGSGLTGSASVARASPLVSQTTDTRLITIM
jgi:hypothetical protein